jgi:hypothetical protein
MHSYSCSVTDLDTFESETVEVDMDSDNILDFGPRVAQEMRVIMPDLMHKGMCVVMYDARGDAVSIFPLDPLQ